MKDKIKIKWQKLKSWILAKSAGINRECLMTLLLGCAIATAGVLAIVIAIKLPIMLLPLALLGLMLVIWHTLRNESKPA